MKPPRVRLLEALSLLWELRELLLECRDGCLGDWAEWELKYAVP